MAFTDDLDWKFIDRLISLADDLNLQANAIKEMSDDPDVLLEALKIESAALIIGKSSRDYRGRLRALKDLEQAARQRAKKKTGPLGVNGPAEAELK